MRVVILILFLAACANETTAERCERACELRSERGCGYSECRSQCARWADLTEQAGCSDEYEIAVDCALALEGACGGECDEAADAALECWATACGPRP